MAQHWRDKPEAPHRGADGVLMWPFGLSQPSVVCAPLQVCDVALQPGEVVNNINLGDKVRWSVTPAISGRGSDRVTHLVIKAQDAGLVTSILVYTEKRTYSIKLISTQKQWTPLTGFSYPQDQEQAWEAYRRAMPAKAAVAGAVGHPGAVAGANMIFYTVSGDHPSWRPERVYSDGRKTYIRFPKDIEFGTAPALIGLNNDGGWFSNASQQTETYRMEGNSFVVDQVLDKAELVLGVGGSQTQVMIERQR